MPPDNATARFARLRIDLAALIANFRFLQECAAPSECGAVVKADAYGLGALEVSEALAAAGCRTFFVSEVYEGVALRNRISAAQIIILSGITEANAAECRQASLTPVLANAAQVDAWRSLKGNTMPAAIKIDTGMSRLGFHWSRFPREDFKDLEISLIMTHLACADTPSHPLNQLQVERFQQVADNFPGIRTSIGNSAGTLMGKATRGDLCRCGIGLYGGNPFNAGNNPFKPVAYLDGQVLQVATLSQDESVGYGASFQASRDLCIATVGVGYANGLPRGLSNTGQAVSGDESFPIIGRISMNLTTLALGRESRLEVGDWVQLIGDSVEIDEVARLVNTISYELLTGLKAPRSYFWGSDS